MRIKILARMLRIKYTGCANEHARKTRKVSPKLTPYRRLGRVDSSSEIQWRAGPLQRGQCRWNKGHRDE